MKFRNPRSLRQAVRSTCFSRRALTPLKDGTANELSIIARPSLVFWAGIWALFLLAIPNNLHADEVELTASVDRNEVRIVDPFQFEIKVDAPQGAQVSFPTIEETLGLFEVLNVKSQFDIPASNQPSQKRSWIQTLSLETLNTGQLQIPSVEVTVAQSGQAARTLRTEPITINAASLVEPAADLTQFKGIADLHDVVLPLEASVPWVWIGSGLAAVGLFAGSLALTTARKKKSLSPLAWALSRLDDTRDLPSAETTLRQYIEERFAFAASSLPPDKIVDHLQQYGVQESVLHGLIEVMRQSERMKFGGLEFSKTEEARLINLASELATQLDKHGENDS